jgi:hypothetical protein
VEITHNILGHADVVELVENLRVVRSYPGLNVHVENDGFKSKRCNEPSHRLIDRPKFLEHRRTFNLSCLSHSGPVAAGAPHVQPNQPPPSGVAGRLLALFIVTGSFALDCVLSACRFLDRDPFQMTEHRAQGGECAALG